MAAFPQYVLDDIARGESFYREQIIEYKKNLSDGCSCDIKNLKCLKNILLSLADKVELEEFDDVSIKLYDTMLLIIGTYTIKAGPTVDAGPDLSAAINSSVVINGSVIPGSAAIISVQWSVVSGSAALTNADTVDVTVDDFSSGPNVLRLSAKDANGKIRSDTMVLTGEALSQVAYWGIKTENGVLAYADIIAGNQVSFASGGDISIPFYTGPGTDFYVLWFAYVSTQPTKNTYTDITDPNNNGSMVSNTDFFSGPTVVTGATPVKYHETNFPTQYKPVNANRGFIFKTE